MKGICHIWSRGRHFSPSLPGDRYLKLSSQKRSPGRNLGEHRLVRRSGTASRGSALLVFCVSTRKFPRTEFTIFLGKISVEDQRNTTRCCLLETISSTRGKHLHFVDENLFEMIAVSNILQYVAH